MARLVGLQTRIRRDRNREDFLRRLLGNSLDIHAARGRGDERDPTDLAVHEHREVQLAIDVGSGLDVHRIHGQTLGPGLMCDEPRA